MIDTSMNKELFKNSNQVSTDIREKDRKVHEFMKIDNVKSIGGKFMRYYFIYLTKISS